MSLPFEEFNADRFLPLGRELGDLSTPHLAISLPTVRTNLARVIDAIGDPVCWRPHLKTTKLPGTLVDDAGSRS